MASTNKLSLAWYGDYESLKQFVYETFKLDGIWTQPGGDRKLYTFEDSTILWKKNKNLLSFNGPKANTFKEELCKQICKCEEDTSELADTHNTSKVHLSELSDLYVDIENMKQDQSVNMEAIRSLSDSILRINSVILEFQDFMGRNKTSPRKGVSAKSFNNNELGENGNQVNTSVIEIDGNDPIVSNQLANPIGIDEAELNYQPTIILTNSNEVMPGLASKQQEEKICELKNNHKNFDNNQQLEENICKSTPNEFTSESTGRSKTQSNESNTSYNKQIQDYRSKHRNYVNSTYRRKHKSTCVKLNNNKNFPPCIEGSKKTRKEPHHIPFLWNTQNQQSRKQLHQLRRRKFRNKSLSKQTPQFRSEWLTYLDLVYKVTRNL